MIGRDLIKLKLSTILILTLIIVWSSIALYAGGLKTSFAEVLLENLQIGKSYNITKIANFPIEVVNTSDKSIKLVMKAVMPDKMKPGFEPIPDLNWIKLSKTEFILKSNEPAKSDITINIPNDKKYLGAKYEVNILSSGSQLGKKGMFGFELALRSRLLFTIYKDKVKDTGNVKKKVNLNFNIYPLNSKISNVNIGNKIDLSQKGVVLKIENQNSKTYHYEIKSLAIKDTVSSIPDDFLPCPDTQFLSFSDSHVKVGPNQTKDVKMFLDFPDNKQYRNKKYMFIISVRVKNKGIAGNRYVRLFVTTKK